MPKPLKIILIILIPVALLAAGLLLAFKVVIPNTSYKAAEALAADGKTVEAFEAFVAMKGYRDSNQKAKELSDDYLAEKLKSVKAGDTIYFGTYEQDAVGLNGAEQIEWMVLAVEGDEALLLSKYALDTQPYNDVEVDITWEKCTLRTWLNEAFYVAAFDAGEQARILTKEHPADENPSYRMDPGNPTTDRVFLLSIPEEETYFHTYDERKCVATEYAKSRGAYISSTFFSNDKNTCWWWLRSPGILQTYAAGVSIDGTLRHIGDMANKTENCVRPAVWIKLTTNQ